MKGHYLYIYKSNLIRVIDGDTVVLDIDLGFDIRVRRVIRMAGIDAPERRGVSDLEKLAAQVSTDKLIEMLDGQEIYICSHKKDEDKYRRYLGDLYVDNQNINVQMVKLGLAKKYIDEKPTWSNEELQKIIGG